MKTFIKRGEELIQELKAELDKDQQDRETEATAEDLKLAIKVIEGMIASAESGKLPAYNNRWPILARMITDTWSVRSELSKKVVKLEREFANL